MLYVKYDTLGYRLENRDNGKVLYQLRILSSLSIFFLYNLQMIKTEPETLLNEAIQI